MAVPQLLQRHITARDINPSPSSVKAGTCRTMKNFLSYFLAIGAQTSAHGPILSNNVVAEKVESGAEGGVEPARPFGQRILSPVIEPLPNLTKRYEPVFTRLAVVKVSLRLASYQQIPPP